jgi:hypothetical protein
MHHRDHESRNVSMTLPCLCKQDLTLADDVDAVASSLSQHLQCSSVRAHADF